MSTRRIAITGATGFLGRYLAARLIERGDRCRAWRRPTSRADGLSDRIEWVAGDLARPETMAPLVEGCDAVVHAALWRPGAGFRGAEGDLLEFVRVNLLGTVALIEAARAARVPRFVFISSCAVHERILDDRPLDEAHPLWPASHYGAHKAAIEKFIHSYAAADGYAICALRPTGIYGAAHPVGDSKWFDLVHAVARGETAAVRRGGKETHAGDVAKAVELLLAAPPERIAGEAFNCYDLYVSEHEVASLAKALSGSAAHIEGQPKRPQHEIVTDKLRALGMRFGGRALLERTIAELLAAKGGA